MTELLVFFSWRVLNVLEKKKESSTLSILLRQQITCYAKTRHLSFSLKMYLC